MTPLFLPGECFSADNPLVHLDLSCKLHIWLSMCVCCRSDKTSRFLSRDSMKLIYGTTDDEISYFMASTLSAQFLLTPAAWTFPKCYVWDTNAKFPWDWFPTRNLWPHCPSVSLCISNVQPPLTNFNLTCVMAGSKKTQTFCKKARNCVKKRESQSNVHPELYI